MTTTEAELLYGLYLYDAEVDAWRCTLCFRITNVKHGQARVAHARKHVREGRVTEYIDDGPRGTTYTYRIKTK